MGEIVTILSLGAGVQSSTMALMASVGELTPKPACAIFADTQAEPKSVYEWLNWLEPRLSFPLIRLTKGNLGDNSTRVLLSKKSGHKYLKGLIPARVLGPGGEVGLLGRKCTADYKVQVVVREARKHCDWKRGDRRHLVDMWIGISRDEAHRMKPARAAWIENKWPLIDRGMTRHDCLRWMASRGFPEPPRSACIFCPLRSDFEWQRMKTDQADEFQEAVRYEQRLQAAASRVDKLRGVPYLHRDCKPLDTIDFTDKRGPSLFAEECEGLCGV